jgi:hypothetical protein
MTDQLEMDVAELEVLIEMREAENGNDEDSEVAEKW